MGIMRVEEKERKLNHYYLDSFAKEKNPILRIQRMVSHVESLTPLKEDRLVHKRDQFSPI